MTHDPRRRGFHHSCSTRLHPGSKTYPRHGQHPVPGGGPAVLAGDDKPEAREVDVTSSYDQRNDEFFWKNSFKTDVALEHGFAKYLPAKTH